MLSADCPTYTPMLLTADAGKGVGFLNTPTGYSQSNFVPSFYQVSLFFCAFFPTLDI